MFYSNDKPFVNLISLVNIASLIFMTEKTDFYKPPSFPLHVIFEKRQHKKNSIYLIKRIRFGYP